jgi:hypothetical protein
MHGTLTEESDTVRRKRAAGIAMNNDEKEENVGDLEPVVGKTDDEPKTARKGGTLGRNGRLISVLQVRHFMTFRLSIE